MARETEYKYDLFDRLMQTTDADDNSIIIGYDVKDYMLDYTFLLKSVIMKTEFK